MNRHILALAFLICLAVPVLAQNSKRDDEKAAAEIPIKLFAAMSTKNGVAISALFIPGGQLVAIDKPRSGSGLSTTRLYTGDSFAKLISESSASELIEKMMKIEVKIFGDMALVYGPYTFHLGKKFSHCGTNIFNLVRTAEGWKIANATSTLEFNCRQ